MNLLPGLKSPSFKKGMIGLLCLVLSWTAAGCSSSKTVSTKLTTAFYPNTFDNAKDWSHGISGDVSTAGDGYVGVSVKAEGSYKVQIVGPDDKYNYDIANDGTVFYFVLSQGSGTYHVRVLKNTEGSKYVEITSRKVVAELKDEFQPFLHANAIVSFTADSKCVAQAGQIAAESADESSFMTNILDYICRSLSYDSELAETVTAGYVPDPDTALQRKKGICYDYASLAAAMLRSQGIPCKLITGYLNDYYHAWNAIYLTDQGWVVTEFDVQAASWSTVDFTLADNGTMKIDNLVYTQCYIY